jgi:hypothetical protein
VLCISRPTAAAGDEADPLKREGDDDAAAVLVLQLAAIARATAEMAFMLAWAEWGGFDVLVVCFVL